MQSLVSHNRAILLAVTGYIKLALNAGKASPAPPVGPALGSKVRISKNHVPIPSLNSVHINIALPTSLKLARSSSLSFNAVKSLRDFKAEGKYLFLFALGCSFHSYSNNCGEDAVLQQKFAC